MILISDSLFRVDRSLPPDLVVCLRQAVINNVPLYGRQTFPGDSFLHAELLNALEATDT